MGSTGAGAGVGMTLAILEAWTMHCDCEYY